MPLRHALIGCGSHGMTHLRTLTSLEITDVKWVVDTREQALGLARASFPGLQFTTDYREMLADAEVESVSIVTNIPTHHRLAIDCANAGKHVLVEKPMTNSIENATAMVETAEKNDVKLMVSQNYRWFADVAAAKQLLEEHDFGRLKFANLTFYLWFGENFQPWREEPHLDRCVMVCHGVHIVDLLRYLTGKEAQSVSCLTQRTNPEFKGETTAFMLVELDDDVPATIHLSFACRGVLAPGQGIHFYQFEKGHLAIDVRRTQKVEAVLYGDPDRNFSPELVPLDELVPPIEHFVDCVENNMEPLTSGRENLGTMRILGAAYESASKRGEAVRLE